MTGPLQILWVTMKLSKPLAPGGDEVTRLERETYQTHCQNIANIIGSVETKERQKAIDLYLESSNAEIEA